METFGYHGDLTADLQVPHAFNLHVLHKFSEIRPMAGIMLTFLVVSHFFSYTCYMV